MKLTMRQWMMISMVVMCFAWVPFMFVPSSKGPDQKALLAQLPAPYSAADPAVGETVFRRSCVLCHTTASAGVNMIGPNLAGLFGRKAAGQGHFGYSGAMKAQGFAWDAPRLDRFIASPSTEVPGTAMPQPNAMSDKERVDLVAYLKIATSQ